MYRVGSLKDSNAELYTSKNYVWTSKPIATLGVKIGCDGILDNSNFKEVIEKLRKVSLSWINGQMTLMGKVTVINTLMGSLFVYKMMSLCNINREDLEEAKKIIRDFLWSGKRAKISLETLMKKKDYGGLKLINMVMKEKALKASRVFGLEMHPLREIVYNDLCPIVRNLIWKCNLCNDDVRKHFDREYFWVQVLMAWSEINFKVPRTKKDVEDQILWWNSEIRINGHPVIWKKWFDKGLLFVKDILNADALCKDPESLGVNWLELQSMYKAIPVAWKWALEFKAIGTDSVKLYDQYFNTKNVSKYLYNELIDDENWLSRY